MAHYEQPFFRGFHPAADTASLEPLVKQIMEAHEKEDRNKKKLGLVDILKEPLPSWVRVEDDSQRSLQEEMDEWVRNAIFKSVKHKLFEMMERYEEYVIATAYWDHICEEE